MTIWVIRRKFVGIVAFLVDVQLLRTNNDSVNDRYYLPRAHYYLIFIEILWDKFVYWLMMESDSS